MVNTIMKFALVLTVFLGSSPSAQAELLCVKNKLPVANNKITLKSAFRTVSTATCPSGYSLVKDLGTLVDKQLVAFARADAAAPLLNFGGSGTTSVTVTQHNTGDAYYRFVFNGNFTGLTASDSEANRNRLSLLAQAATFDYGVTNVAVEAASSTQIVVLVSIWRSSDLNADYQHGVSVSVLLGRTS